MLVTVEYWISAKRAGVFVRAMEVMRSVRRREGALRWDLCRDLADPDRRLETFHVPSWAEHRRQHIRVTVDNQATEARAFASQQPGVQPGASHLIGARAFHG